MNFSFRFGFIAALILSLIAFSPTFAQTQYAIDSQAGCRGEVPADPGLSPTVLWSAEAWVYLLEDEIHQQLILRSDSQVGNFSLGVLEGKASATLILTGPVALEVSGQTPLPLGAWAHLAMCYDGGGLRLFMNGIQEAFLPYSGTPAQAPGPIYIGGSSTEQFCGWVDETRLSDTIRYDENFDPFYVYLVDLRVGDQQVPGWALGTGAGDLAEAWDYQSLYDLIDGAAEVYIAHNFQYAVRQYYYGQIGGQDEELELWMFDQGTPEDAEELFHDPLIAPPAAIPIDNIGAEARIDSGFLYFVLDFWRDQYYAKIMISHENGTEEAWQTALDFGAEADTNIITRNQFNVDANTVALWHFDEGSGSLFQDASGNGHDGTLINPAWAATTPYQEVLYITSAQLLEGIQQSTAIDDDDTARITFSTPVAPLAITSRNIDDILQLSQGHSWLSGGNQIGSATWNDSGDTLCISFSLEGGAPTLANGDTLYPNPEYLYSIDSLQAGGYRFVRFEEVSSVHALQSPILPQAAKLFPPRPTPFNARTRITYQLAHSSYVTLCILNLSGREVGELHRGFQDAGLHAYDWNPENLASGIYFISLRADHDQLVRKTVLIK